MYDHVQRMARKYELRRRAEKRDETRRRITEAALELHRSVGAARTTVSALAERAGVQRHTVYAHFPDEDALLHACTSHWAEQHPFPDLGRWASLPTADERLRRTFRDLYAFYGSDDAMLANGLRDSRDIPFLRERWGHTARELAALADDLTRAFRLRGGRRTRARAAVGHALHFTTWRSLAREQGLSSNGAAELMVRLVRAAASE